MTDREASSVLNRLRAVEWMGDDWDHAFGHVKSRRVLFREYLRRAAVWSQAYSVEGWPFFDVTGSVDPGFELSPEIAAELGDLLKRLTTDELRDTCAGAVRLAELQAKNPAVGAGLPDLYEPLVIFYERGGEFAFDNAGFLDLTGVRYRPASRESYLSSPPVVELGDAVLDALDVAGRVTYYTAADGQGPLLRRSVERDELFGRDLRWETTDVIPASEELVKEAGLIELDELAATRIIGAIVAAGAGTNG
ncbi:hypothetical protein [Streptomyces lavendulae]|uniref:hypothetical protein n=1 Tax=Streptomyces lavendulae TaxID=1914 RepID=UPI0024A2E18F|nr:hypothetical protein [Streptomyces lavendulae]GLX20586.1 hypothetical protein Slala01_42300 [Streptomyces lavendulae subsp. lavendulae]GLX28252.1 hypothetical protein Slala02_40720 [Streptomyces lavendulae subsp. lavendulae]